MLGIHVSRKNFEAFVHFWRVIGYMIGIEDRFNLCTDSWETTKPRLELILSDVYRPYLAGATSVFEDMATALLDGLWCFNPFLTSSSFLYFTRMITECEGYTYMSSDLKMIEDRDESVEKINSLHWYSKLLVLFQYTVHTFFLNFFIFRWYFNSQIYISIFIMHWFPFLAIFKYGIKNAYVKILRGQK